MSAWSKLPRSILGAFRVTEGSDLTAGKQQLTALNNRGQWHECLVEAAAKHFKGFRGLKAGKQQA